MARVARRSSGRHKTANASFYENVLFFLRSAVRPARVSGEPGEQMKVSSFKISKQMEHVSASNNIFSCLVIVIVQIRGKTGVLELKFIAIWKRKSENLWIRQLGSIGIRVKKIVLQLSMRFLFVRVVIAKGDSRRKFRRGRSSLGSPYTNLCYLQEKLLPLTMKSFGI